MFLCSTWVIEIPDNELSVVSKGPFFGIWVVPVCYRALVIFMEIFHI